MIQTQQYIDLNPWLLDFGGFEVMMNTSTQTRFMLICQHFAHKRFIMEVSLRKIHLGNT
ncbi:hypothetical protein HanXRQr2_Chr10g0465421 [Helianthus annuus]|uniref:Uncharacterized protein n=1 Tax=Helianthus annuus TaxID=4232 RepID=A0A251TQC9_HELAN|nr:hypothetical protein HanXRQr2_Chr10g0465421 [Helianthus annuus]